MVDTNLKMDFGMLERLYDEFYTLVKEFFPKENTMTNTFYDTKKQIAALGMLMEKINICPNGCIIY